MGLDGWSLSNAETTFGAQTIGALTIFVWVFAASFILWLIIKKVLGIRGSAEEENKGLDVSECGVETYPEFTNKN